MSAMDNEKILDAILENTRLNITHNKPSPLNSEDYDYVQHNPELALALIRKLMSLPEQDMEDDDNYFAHFLVLELALANLRYAYEREERFAIKLHKQLQQHLIDFLQLNTNVNVSHKVISLCHEIKLPISEAVKEEYVNLLDQSRDERTEQPQLSQFLTSIIDENPDANAFFIADMFRIQSQSLPHEFKARLVMELVNTEMPIAQDAAVLLLLHPEKETRAYILDGLMQAYENSLVTPTSMNRLLIIRDWYPKDERPALEQFIAEQRKKNAVFATVPESPVVMMRASEFDGSGVQLIMFQVKEKNKYRECGCLVKHNVGIRDSWSSGFMTKKKLDQFLNSEEANLDRPLVYKSVDSEYVRKIISHYIHVGCQHGEAPEAGLLEIAEITGLKAWRAEAIHVENEMELLFNDFSEPSLTSEFTKKSLKRSSRWFDTQEFTNSWFEVSDEIDRVVNQHSHIIDGVKISDVAEACDEVMIACFELLRNKWMTQLLFMSMWAKCAAKKNEVLWKDFAILVKQLFERRALAEIPFIQALCEETVIASIETMYDRKAYIH